MSRTDNETTTEKSVQALHNCLQGFVKAYESGHITSDRPFIPMLVKCSKEALQRHQREVKRDQGS